MTNTRKTERLYLNSWSYNAARILSALAVIVENNGGEIQYSSYDKTYELTNRSIDSMILENENRIERAKTHMSTCKENGLTFDENKINNVIANLEKENAEILEKYGAEANEPIICTHKSYIKFIYNNDYYYYDVDDNPFFDFHFQKYPIENGKYDANRYGIEDKKEWLFDCFFKCGCSDADITEAANLIFNMLVKSNYGQLITERKRVPNYYDNKYHYENIHEKRMVEVGKLF